MKLLFALLAFFTFTKQTKGEERCEWERSEHMKAVKAVRQGEHDSLQQCQEACLRQRHAGCRYGLNWVGKYPKGERCWFAGEEAFEKNVESDHYFCTCAWLVYNFVETRQMALVSAGMPLARCKFECEKERLQGGCQHGVVYKQEKELCFIANNSQSIDNHFSSYHFCNKNERDEEIIPSNALNASHSQRNFLFLYHLLFLIFKISLNKYY